MFSAILCLFRENFLTLFSDALSLSFARLFHHFSSKKIHFNSNPKNSHGHSSLSKLNLNILLSTFALFNPKLLPPRQLWWTGCVICSKWTEHRECQLAECEYNHRNSFSDGGFHYFFELLCFRKKPSTRTLLLGFFVLDKRVNLSHCCTRAARAAAKKLTITINNYSRHLDSHSRWNILI